MSRKLADGRGSEDGFRKAKTESEEQGRGVSGLGCGGGSTENRISGCKGKGKGCLGGRKGCLRG